MRDAGDESASLLSWISVSTDFMMSSGFAARAFFYPTLLWNVMMQGRNRRWYDKIEETLILGALPFKSQTKQLVEEENVKAVVTLNEDYETKYLCNTTEEWASWGVKHLCLATVDFNNAPPQQMLEQGVSFIEDMRSQDNTVYVHCKAGRGRSATLVACYLMKNSTMNPSEAHSFIKSKRPHIKLGSRQWDAVNEFYNRMNTEK